MSLIFLPAGNYFLISFFINYMILSIRPYLADILQLNLNINWIKNKCHQIDLQLNWKLILSKSLLITVPRRLCLKLQRWFLFFFSLCLVNEKDKWMKPGIFFKHLIVSYSCLAWSIIPGGCFFFFFLKFLLILHM